MKQLKGACPAVYPHPYAPNLEPKLHPANFPRMPERSARLIDLSGRNTKFIERMSPNRAAQPMALTRTVNISTTHMMLAGLQAVRQSIAR